MGKIFKYVMDRKNIIAVVTILIMFHYSMLKFYMLKFDTRIVIIALGMLLGILMLSDFLSAALVSLIAYIIYRIVLLHAITFSGIYVLPFGMELVLFLLFFVYTFMGLSLGIVIKKIYLKRKRA